jgi:hypothetical protein
MAASLSRTTEIFGDVLGAVALVYCIPIAMVVIAAPVFLCIRLLLWSMGAL